jgi:GT2 family glycosyltransferase
MPLRAAAIEVVFGFLRPRRQVPAALSSPLRSAQWDGAMLTLAFDEGASGDIALDLDGCFFSSAPIDGGRCARFAFAFSPSGRTAAGVMPRLGRDGTSLAAAPLRLRFGTSAFVAAAAGEAPGALASLGAPAQLVPFGVDVAAPEVTIVVPVYNAPMLVARCLDSVLAHTTGRARLIVIDDASPDPAVAPMLARYVDIARVCLLHNESNRGFTATANRGIGTAGAADVVLLNADTEVGPNWLQGLRRAAYASADVGTATAVSDNAGAFAVPELEQANPLPACWTFDESARALWQQAGLAYPCLPTGNGFCLYIRRAVIDAVGLLDEAAFAQGYGEENDFCQRAARHGFRHLIAGNVLVKHARSQSFGEERRIALGRAGMAVLRERYRDYENEVGATLFSFERRVLDWRVRRIFADAREGNAAKPRVLWVGAGAPDWSDAEVWNLRANGATNELAFAGEVITATFWKADDSETSYRALWEWLQLYAIERLAVTQTKDSVAEILCGLLDIPVVCVGHAIATSAHDSLHRAESALRSFPGRPI